MPKFNLDNYELVEDRLKKFWEDHPNGRINTDVVNSSADGTMVIVKAELFMNKDDDTPVSSGLAQETKGQGGFANTDSWMENAETSAIGRALANWKYQGSGKPRPSREEMSKVGTGETNKNLDASSGETNKNLDASLKKKPVTQETGNSHSKSRITVAELKKMVFSSCNEDKNFAAKCYKDCMNRTVIKTKTEDVTLWEDETIRMFLDFVDVYVAKHKDTFKEREGNDPIVNKIIEGMEVEVKEIDMSDVPSGKWEGDPPSDKQISILEEKIKDAIDSGNDELAAKAKSFLNSGNATKKNIFDWINTEGDWSLKDGS